MLKQGRTSAYPFLGAALLLSAAFAVTASADTKVFVYGPPAAKTAEVRHRYHYFPCPERDSIVTGAIAAGLPPGGGFSNTLITSRQVNEPKFNDCPPCAGGPSCSDHVIQSGAAWYDGGVVGAKVKTDAYAIPVGNCEAGGTGLRTSARGDTVFAKDSVNADVTTTGNTLLINNFTGEMRNDPGGVVVTDRGLVGLRPAKGTFYLAVYPTIALARADLSNSGVGAVFFGKVSLAHRETPLEVSAPIAGVPGFAPGDFTLTSLADGTLIATPAAGLSKSVTVANGNTAVVAFIHDPKVGLDGALPGASPATTAALTVVLLGAGLWVMRHRMRTAA